MTRLRLGQFVAPLDPLEWPDGTEQPVKRLTWAEQELLADMESGEASVRAAMPRLMPALLPGRTWDEIKAALDMEAMRAVIAYASGDYERAMRAMEEAAGNGVGATAPPSDPVTPPPTSSRPSPAPTAAPCGMS